MARLINAEILRSSANGPQDGDDFAAGQNIEILETQGEWTKVRAGGSEGWVPTSSVDAVGTSGGPAGPFDANAFADICVLESLTHDVNPHYLIGVAKLRSDLTASDSGNEIGPFRLTTEDWAKILDAGFSAGDLRTWDLQCAGFAVMVERITASLGANASPVDLYRAQWLHAPADIAGNLKTAFDATAQLEADAERRVVGQPAPSKINDPSNPVPRGSRGTLVQKLIAANAQRWQSMQITPGRIAAIDAVAQQLVGAKQRYQGISATTNVPWFVIAAIHEREKAGDTQFKANIAQGDPWNQRSTHVPIGRGPFGSFEDAAVDALTNCAPFAARWTDWSVGGALTLLEQYNGLGYAMRRLPSPYIWSFSDQYVKGKFVRDHVFDPNTVDAQLGSAPLLKRMQAQDPSIVF